MYLPIASQHRRPSKTVAWIQTFGNQVFEIRSCSPSWWCHRSHGHCGCWQAALQSSKGASIVVWNYEIFKVGNAFDSFDRKSCTKELPDIYVESRHKSSTLERNCLFKCMLLLQHRNMRQQHHITIWSRLKWVIASVFSFDHLAHVSPQTWGNHWSSHRSYHYGKGQHTVASSLKLFLQKTEDDGFSPSMKLLCPVIVL